MELCGLLSTLGPPTLRRMTDFTGDTAALPGGDLVTMIAGAPTRIDDPPLSAAGKAALGPIHRGAADRDDTRDC